MTTLSPTDPLLTRAAELVAKHLPAAPTLWLKPPGDTPRHHPGSAFWHPWYPEHARLKMGGWQEMGQAQSWAQVVLFGGRQKDENRQLLQAAQGLAGPEGRVFFALPNDYGGRSFHKELEGLLDNISGRKSRLFVLPGGGHTSPLYTLQKNRHDQWSCPGLFSWDRVDRGSQLLAEVLGKEDLTGPVADLGAGWGYLSSSLRAGVQSHLFEADRRGVEACQANCPHSKVYWCDVTDQAGLPAELFGRLRSVVMNPPFHTHKRSEPVLGGAFVATASRLLAKGGKLYLVGNSHLPYPKLVETLLGDSTIILQQDGYTVVRGIKK